MAYHLGDEAFAGSATSVALVADGRDNSCKLKWKKVTCYRCQKKGHLASECLAVKPVAKKAEASAAVAITSPTDDSGFAWSLSATDVPGLSRDCFYSDSGGTLHICTHTDWFTDLSPKVVKLQV